MKLFISTILLITLYSCNQSSNSNTFDRSFSEDIGIDRSTANGERLYQAYTVIKQNCISCHTGYHNTWTSYNTDILWINSGLVETNDAFSSSLIIRLKNLGGNMPKDSSQISEEELDILSEWIDGI